MKQWSEGVREMRQLVDTRCEAISAEMKALKSELQNEVEQVTIPMVANYVLMEHKKKSMSI